LEQITCQFRVNPGFLCKRSNVWLLLCISIAGLNSVVQKNIEGLRKGISRWPHNSVFRNYLYNAYLLLGDKKAADAEMHETVILFPEYLVAKNIYAEWLLKHDRSEEVPGLFNSKWYLSDLYSVRKRFHNNEFIHFNSTWLLIIFISKTFAWLIFMEACWKVYLMEPYQRHSQ
jgi:hypothetical protein